MIITAEVVVFLVVMGSILAFVFHRHLKKNTVRPEMEASAVRLRYEMEASADEIIARLSERVDQLERLIEEADERSAQLEWQLKQAQGGRAEEEYYRQSEEPPQWPHRTADYRRSPGFSNILEDSLRSEDMANEVPVPLRGAIARQAYTTTVPGRPAVAPVVNVPVQKAAPDEGLVNAAVEAVRAAADRAGSTPEEAVPETVYPVPSYNDSALLTRVNEMLEGGATVEEVSRQLNLGRGALELIKQMNAARPKNS